MIRFPFHLLRGLAAVACLTVLGVSVPPCLARDAAVEKADQLRNQREYAAAAAAYEAILAKPQNSIERQSACYWGVVECMRRQKKPADALSAVDRFLAVLPADDPGRRSAAETRVDLLLELGRREDAAAYADECAAKAAQDPDAASLWYGRAAGAWLAAKQYGPAAASAARGVEAARQAENLPRAAGYLWLASDIFLAAGDPEKALVPLRQFLDLKDDRISADSRLKAQTRLGDCLVKLNRLAEARQAFQSFIAAEPSADLRQRWWMATARTFQTEKNTAGALDAYENVLTAQAGMAGYEGWFDAQSQIADLLSQSGNAAGALQAARVCFDLADSRERVMSASGRIIQLFHQADGKKSERVKTYLAWQRSGAAGADEKPGTADDVAANPLDAVPRAASPGREKAFAAAAATLGTDARALIQRGLMCAALGQKQEACAFLMEACRRASGDEVLPAYNALIFVGVRGVRGHAAGLDGITHFLVTGPASAPAAAGAAVQPQDDPLAALALPPAAVRLAPADEAVLRDLRLRLERIVEDGNWPEGGRRDAAAALLRVHGALGEWGAKDVLDWYLDRLAAERDARVTDFLVQGTFAASRRGRVDWGETRGLLASADSAPPALARAFEQLAKSRQNPLPALQKLEDTAKPASLFRR